MNEITTIAMTAADAYSTEHYGIQLKSVAVYDMAGRGVHNRHHSHTIKVWENRERDGILIDPHGRPTTDTHSVTTSANATMITAHPQTNRAPEGGTLTIGQTVRLVVNGFPIGDYRVEAPMMSDPILVKI